MLALVTEPPGVPLSAMIGVLAAIVVPKFTNRSGDARKTAAKTDISGISTALAAFEIEQGRFPTNDEGLTALVTPPANSQSAKTYLPRVPKDPWGNAYIYKFPGQKNPTEYDIYSFGPDGREGGEDDIGNWE